MKSDNQILSLPLRTVEEMEGAHRATGISSTVAATHSPSITPIPEPEVLEKPIRRRFTADYKFGSSPKSVAVKLEDRHNSEKC